MRADALSDGNLTIDAHVPSGWHSGRDFAKAIEPVVSASLALKIIQAGWDDMLRFVASVRAGRMSVNVGLRLWGSAASGDPARRAAEELGRLLSTMMDAPMAGG